MSVIGVELDHTELVLTKGRDFRWDFLNLDSAGSPIDYPSGTLYFEIATPAPLTWLFTISGANASLKVESTVVDTIANRTKWQLVFKPAGEADGGDIVAFGTVRIQG